jgi:hypothetical protein
LTLTSEWTPYRWGPVLSKDRVASLFDNTGYLYLTETEAASHANAKEVEAEIRAQIKRARSLGIQPTHLDSHMGTLYQNKTLGSKGKVHGRSQGCESDLLEIRLHPVASTTINMRTVSPRLGRWYVAMTCTHCQYPLVSHKAAGKIFDISGRFMRLRIRCL